MGFAFASKLFVLVLTMFFVLSLAERGFEYGDCLDQYA